MLVECVLIACLSPFIFSFRHCMYCGINLNDCILSESVFDSLALSSVTNL
jgi:hypothetical protein